MSLWIADAPLTLASGSATRRLLLESAGIPVRICPAAIDERVIEAPLVEAGAAPPMIAALLSQAKALAVSRDHPDAIVLGADQVLALGATLFSKPPTLDAARDHLRALSGRTHSLHAAFALARDGVVIAEGAAEARLRMRPLSEAFIERYLASEGPGVCSSVGAYKLEGLGVHLFAEIAGEHSTILGLPLLALLPVLRQFGYLIG